MIVGLAKRGEMMARAHVTPGIPPGAVWFLGGSFTEGYGVNDGEEYPALVSALAASA